MRVALDAPAGADLAALAAGALRAAAGGVEVELVGPAALLPPELPRLPPGGAGAVSVVDAPSSFGAEEAPAAACREKGDSSLMRSAEAVAQKRCAAFVTPATPAAAAAAGLWHLKRLKGVLKPALALPMRTPRGSFVLMDAGACLDCKPWHLLQFALMGAMYSRRLLGTSEPGVALLAEGKGAQLGGELPRESLPLLKYAGVRFIGPLTAAEALRGGCDVLVADGFSGSVLAGAASVLPGLEFEMLESDLGKDAFSRLGGRLASRAVAGARERAHGPAAPAAALLGVGGAALVCRRASDPAAVAEALLVAQRLAGAGLETEIQARLEDMKSGMEFARTID
ncbi:MAG: hypothetical protein HY928_17960 [Elusimicrobia bacterium]|nr:hypothetical protein [Elusimicrobiota bacterium]